MGKRTGLSVIPFKHFGWHSMTLYTAYAFVWIGFLIAVYRAWGEGDLTLLAFALMLLGIGLLIFRGVAFFMNTGVLLSTYISQREMRKEEEIIENQKE